MRLPIIGWEISWGPRPATKAERKDWEAAHWKQHQNYGTPLPKSMRRTKGKRS